MVIWVIMNLEGEIVRRDCLNSVQRNHTGVSGFLLLLVVVLFACQVFAVPQHSGSEQPVNVVVTRFDDAYPEEGSPTSLLLGWLEAVYSDHPTVLVRFADFSEEPGISSLNGFIENLPVGSFIVIHGDCTVSHTVNWDLKLDIALNSEQSMRSSPLEFTSVEFQQETSETGSRDVPEVIRFAGYAALASLYYQRDEISVAGQACSQALGAVNGVPENLVAGIESLRTNILAEVQLANDLYHLSEEIEIDLENSSLYMERALLNARLKNFEECANDLESAILLGPPDENSSVIFAESILDIQTWIRSACNEGVHVDPGIFDSIESRMDDALEYLNSAIEFNPHNAEIYMTRAQVFGYLIDWTAAYDDASKAIELEPDYHQALAYRGSVNIEMGYPDEAVQDLSRAIELAADSVSYLESRAFAYQMLGDEENAQADFARISELLLQ